jgi:hypothetical protein
LDECSYFVFCSMRGQPQFPHTSLIPFLWNVKVNVGSECLEFKGRGRVKREKLNLEREKLNLWGVTPAPHPRRDR